MLAVGLGDRGAFAELVERHHARAFRVASRFLGNREEAADIVQEAFLKILSAAPRYRPTSAFGTYLYQVVANLCLDHRRKARPETDAPIEDRQSEAPSVLETLIRGQRSAALLAALRSLPPRQRLAVILKYNEEMSYREIAEVLEASEKGVERLLAHARGALLGNLAGF
jgi:RNA polymerase sigma-70 factor (ECF subfamily)